MPINYSSISGPIYAGLEKPEVIPQWVSNIALNTWAEIPDSNRLRDLNPQNDPLLNPRYTENPQDPPRPEFMGDHASIISTWCGACNDEENNILYLPLNGGHGDYAGNEPYKIDLNSENPEWIMIRPPSGAIGNELTTNDGQESTGLYSDGRLRAIHSYNKHVFVPDVGLVVATLGNTAHSGQAGLSKLAVIDPDTGELVRFSTDFNPNAATSSGSGSCYDPSRHWVWYRGAGTGRMVYHDLTNDTWGTRGAISAGSGYAGLTYVPEWDCILLAKDLDDTPSQISIFDCSTNQRTIPNIIGSAIGLGPLGGGRMWRQIDSNTFACWNNSSNTEVINTLSFTGDPRTSDFTIGQLPVAPSNSVFPSTRTPNHTYGRFFHMPKWGLLGVINSTAQPIYAYRYKNI